jgi:hypothetical protein
MSQIQFQRIWIDQCAAALRVKEHFGLANALEYLIGEKLLNFAQVAEVRRSLGPCVNANRAHRRGFLAILRDAQRPAD